MDAALPLLLGQVLELLLGKVRPSSFALGDALQLRDALGKPTDFLSLFDDGSNNSIQWHVNGQGWATRIPTWSVIEPIDGAAALSSSARIALLSPPRALRHRRLFSVHTQTETVEFVAKFSPFCTFLSYIVVQGLQRVASSCQNLA